MGKRKRAITIIMVLILAVVLAAVSFYFLVLPTFAIVSDEAWSTCFSTSQMLGLRASYALDGYRLKVVKLGSSDMYNPEVFRNVLSKLKSDYVVLGPVASAYAVQNKLDVSFMLEDSVVLAIGAEDSDLFDCLLLSDERSGWLSASKAIAQQTSASSKNVALVYESDVISYANDITNLFPSGGVSVFDKSKGGNVFYRSTLQEMDRLGIVIALCPYVSGMGNFFDEAGTVSWIVDYRFRSAIPAANLYGTVGPDLKNILAIAKDVEKGSCTTHNWEFVYEKVRRVL